MMMTITCKIPRDLDVTLVSEARRRQVSKSRVVRDALERELRRRHGKPSLYDRIKDVAGSLEGPGDLSTNAKYMEEFGA